MVSYFLGVQAPAWLSYGMVPIIICLTGHYFVYAYLLISGAISSVNDELEEAGAIGGLSRQIASHLRHEEWVPFCAIVDFCD